MSSNPMSIYQSNANGSLKLGWRLHVKVEHDAGVIIETRPVFGDKSDMRGWLNAQINDDKTKSISVSHFCESETMIDFGYDYSADFLTPDTSIHGAFTSITRVDAVAPYKIMSNTRDKCLEFFIDQVTSMGYRATPVPMEF